MMREEAENCVRLVRSGAGDGSRSRRRSVRVLNMSSHAALIYRGFTTIALCHQLRLRSGDGHNSFNSDNGSICNEIGVGTRGRNKKSQCWKETKRVICSVSFCLYQSGSIRREGLYFPLEPRPTYFCVDGWFVLRMAESCSIKVGFSGLHGHQQ